MKSIKATESFGLALKGWGEEKFIYASSHKLEQKIMDEMRKEQPQALDHARHDKNSLDE